MVWRKNSPFAPDVREFVPSPSQVKDSQLNELLKKNPTPFELLQYFLDKDMMDEIVNESTRYSETIIANHPNSLKNFKAFQKDEFWAFLGLNLLMGVINKPSVTSYWSTNLILTTPVFNKTMSRPGGGRSPRFFSNVVNKLIYARLA